MHNTQETSVESYNEIKPTLGKRHTQVLRTFRSFGNMSNARIARELRIPINTVTPRVNELCKKGLVERKGIGLDKNTNRRVIIWGLVLNGYIHRVYDK